jgi:antagonist of KipI
MVKEGSVFNIDTSGARHPGAFVPLTSTLPSEVHTIQVMTGPEFRHLTKEAVARLFGNTYRASSESNQMGYRLKGNPVPYPWEREMISSGIVPGTIQLTSSGQLIILLAHAQTIGGYPRVLNVISEDLDMIAQVRPNQSIRFELV